MDKEFIIVVCCVVLVLFGVLTAASFSGILQQECRTTAMQIKYTAPEISVICN